MGKLYVIGNASVRITARSRKEISLKEFNSSRIEASYDGVAYDIAKGLCGLEEKPVFVSAFGNDVLGRALFDDCQRRGMDLQYCEIVEGISTPTTLINQQPNGDEALVMGDCSLVLTIDKSTIDRLKDDVREDDFVIVDASLDVETIRYLFEAVKGIKVVDATSKADVKKVLRSLPNISLLKLNKEEAEAICGMSLDSDVKFISLLKMLNDKGIDEVLVTDKNGVYIGVPGLVYHYQHDAYDQSVKNGDGAGNSLLASYSYAKLHNASIESSAIMGLVSAVLMATTPKTDISISKSDIRNALSRINVTGGIIYRY